VQFNILGPLEVVEQGRAMPLGGIKQRAMLGMLLLRANRVVPSSKLLEYLWANGVPPTARKMLQNAASGLRDMLACDSDSDSANPPVLLTHAPGYLLHVEPGSIDENLFARHTERGRSNAADGDWESARRELRRALGVWRGPVLADLVEAGTVWPEVSAVQNTHLVVVEELFDAELACGRHREVVAELESAAEREPSRQHLAMQLMLGLYRCGRQLDALDVYHRTRARLIETRGLEPSRELQELEHSILNQDPRLDWRGTMSALVGSGAATALQSAADLADPASMAVPAVLPKVAPADGRVIPLAQGRPASMMVVVAEVDRRTGASVARAEFSLGVVAAIVDREVSRCGGMVISKVGSSSWVVFSGTGNAAMQAVDAGLAIREALTTPRAVSDAAGVEVPPLEVKVAIVSTSAMLSCQSGDGTLRGLDSAIVGQCLQLASAAPPGRVWAGEETKRATERSVRYEQADDGAWDAVERLPELSGPDRPKLVIEGPGEIQKLRVLLTSIGGEAARLAERIDHSRSGDIPESAVVEFTVSVLLPVDHAPNWALCEGA
jgi:DNA-binding SARP family transcriptional activator